MAYIYMIRNKINDKKYVGKTNFSIEKRWQEHCKDAKKNRKERRPLYNAILKYGEENFEIIELEECLPEESSQREQYWIQQYNTFVEGYNATKGGDGKFYLDYKKILRLYDTTSFSQKEIAKECNCCTDSVRNIVSQYRDNIDWDTRYKKKNGVAGLEIKGLPVECIETGQTFHSCTAAANWLVENGRIKSQSYGRKSIPEVCRGERKTVGGYHWKFI